MTRELLLDHSDGSPTTRGRWAVPVLLFVTFFALWLPGLGSLPFFNSIENIVVETALEARRDGHWLIPRMVDRPRARKPPLPVWLSAAAVQPETVAELSSTDPAAREAAYVRLAREVRLPALLAACLTLVATFELARVLAGGSTTVGLAAAVAAGTSLLFLQTARLATPDTHLMLWVTACNAMLARALFLEQRWLGCCGAGVFLGLAMMCKGPVALIQTLVPAAMLLACRPFTPSATNASRQSTRVRSWAAPVGVGMALFLCVALPWPWLATVRVEGVWGEWFHDITRVDPADPRPEPWHYAFHIFGYLMPWTVWLVLGLIGVGSSLRRRADRTPMLFAFWLFVVPVVVFGVMSERKPRYLLPVIPAGAVLVGWALVQTFAGGVLPRWRWWSDPLTHYVCVGATVAVLAVLGAGRLVTTDGSPWFSPAVAATLAGAGVGCVLAGAACQRWWRERALVVATLAAMLLFDAAYTFGSSRSPERQSNMKPLADAICAHAAPDASVWNIYPGDPDRNAPLDLSIYLNRVVRPAGSPDAIIAAARPEETEQVIVIGTQKGEPPPGVPGPNWAPIGVARRGDVTWHAYQVRLR